MSSLDYNYFLSNNGHPTQRKGWTHNVQGKCDLARALARRCGRRSRRGGIRPLHGQLWPWLRPTTSSSRRRSPCRSRQPWMAYPRPTRTRCFRSPASRSTAGKKAQAYANNYILVHMREACDAVTSADGARPSSTRFRPTSAPTRASAPSHAATRSRPTRLPWRPTTRSGRRTSRATCCAARCSTPTGGASSPRSASTPASACSSSASSSAPSGSSSRSAPPPDYQAQQNAGHPRSFEDVRRSSF